MASKQLEILMSQVQQLSPEEQLELINNSLTKLGQTVRCWCSVLCSARAQISFET